MGIVALWAGVVLLLLWIGRYFLGSSPYARALLLGSFLLKAIFIALVFHLFPERPYSTDGTRYFFEMSGIAEDPVAWNFLSGQGPQGYKVSPKLGMPYLYGVLAYLFRSDVLLTALTLNVLFSTLTSLFCVGLFRLITNTDRGSWVVFVLATLHPEIFFWNALIVRENLSLFCVVAGVYVSALLVMKRSFACLVLWSAIVFWTFVTRVQLVIFQGFFLGLLLRSRY
jgi:hypothetical protein